MLARILGVVFRDFFKIKKGDYYHPLVVFLSVGLFFITLGAAAFNFLFFGKFIFDFVSFALSPVEDALVPDWAFYWSDAPFGNLILLIIAAPIALAVFAITFIGTVFLGLIFTDKILRPLDDFLTRNWEWEED